MPAEIEGVCPIVPTPFAADGAVDYDSLRNVVRAMAEGGCHATALFGIASEFYKLADAERDRMVEVVTDVAGEHDLPLVISVTHEATAVAVDWARSYEAAGADCLMVFTPTFRDPSSDQVLDHLRAIGETVSIPVMVQHTPMNVSVSPADFAALHEAVPNVRYFKIETSPPGPFISALVKETDGSVDVLVGSAGTQMIEAYDRGAVGVMPAAAAFELYLHIHDAYRDGRRKEAIDAHTDMLALQNQVRQAGIQSVKRLLAERGLVATDHCRRPLPPAPDGVHDDLLETYYGRISHYLDDHA